MSALDRHAARRVATVTARLAARLGDAMPGARVEHEAGRITIAGRGLHRRRLGDPALRWPAGLLK